VFRHRTRIYPQRESLYPRALQLNTYAPESEMIVMGRFNRDIVCSDYEFEGMEH
jgi:hypothetical protein